MGRNYSQALRGSIKLGTLVAVALILLALGQSRLIADEPYFAAAVAVDLIFTLPIAYFLIIRKTSVPKITVVPVVFACLFLASTVLPDGKIAFIRTLYVYAVPGLELVVLGYLGFRIYRTRKAFTANALSGRDLIERLRSAFVIEIRPAVVARATAFEIGTFWIAFFVWRRPKVKAFSYDKRNSPRLLLSMFLFLLIVETIVVHVLVAMWSPIAAWVTTAVSIYFAIQIFAHLKAIHLRPIAVTENLLYLRCGILGDATIDLESIDSVGKVTQPAENADDWASLTPLGNFSPPNVMLSLIEETTIFGVYGIEKRVSKLFFAVDEPDKLIEQLSVRI